MMHAEEELMGLLDECPECHYSSSHEDWGYKPFSNREVVICPQCGNEINLSDLYDKEMQK